MIVYIAALVAFALVLYVSYRALGWNPTSAGEAREALRQLAGRMRDDLEELSAAVGSAAPAISDDRNESLVNDARAIARRVTASQQQLSRLDVADADDAAETMRAALVLCAEDAIWACRLIETQRYAENEGFRGAVAALLHSARRYAAEAVRTGESLSAASPSPAGTVPDRSVAEVFDRARETAGEVGGGSPAETL